MPASVTASHAEPTSTAPGTLGHEVVLIPVKGFRQAKRRLGGSMSDEERVRWCGRWPKGSWPPAPRSPSPSSATTPRWPTGPALGATVMWEPGHGLNGAVEAGVEQLAAAGVERVTVAHGDLPRARDLGALAPFDGITLVPDRQDDGTNVLRLPAGCGFRFAYGPGSFRSHLAEAVRLGLPVRVLRIPALAYDVDWPADCRPS